MSIGRFITFEGIDGCGKSTQVTRVFDILSADGVPCLLSREPGGTVISEKIRELILSPAHEEMTDTCELLLYCASRAQHVQEKIIPAIERGMVVICDRYELATIAYQGYGRGINLSQLGEVNSFATGGLKPSLSFILDIPVEIARDRLAKTGKAPDRLEKNPAGFYERVRQGYRESAAADPARVVLLDGTRGMDELTAEIVERVRSRVNAK